jgi:KUP system potassium uptake protein
VLVLRAHNDGEGGVFALYGLLHAAPNRSTRGLLWLLMLGAGLLFGDGILTPAISVLSAVEGLGVAAPGLQPAVVPGTLALLCLLFALQRHGTGGIGRVFGPLMVLWFLTIGALGLAQVLERPQVLAALDPLLGFRFLLRAGPHGALVVLGSLILVVTGGEALYADLGHFGARAIRQGWFLLVFPALLLNYLGQGALLLAGAPPPGTRLFFALVPAGALVPMIVLAVLATFIASQSLISGAFSLATQATRLGLLPRLMILHTHPTHSGQVYLPFINGCLFVGCVALVLGFGSSSALAAAYGVAVAGVMVITSVAMHPVARLSWGWAPLPAALVWGGFSALNGAFFLATALKFFEGGFVPLGLGVAVFLVMATWRWGRKATFAGYSAKATMTVAELVELHRRSSHFLERTAVLMVPKPVRQPRDNTPALLQLLWDRYELLPRNLFFVEVTHRKLPYIRDNRYLVTVLDRDPARGSLIGVELSFGFMEEPNVEAALEGLARHHQIDLPTDRRKWIVHISHENLLPSRAMGRLARLRLQFFLLLRRVSRPAYSYYGLGDEVQLSTEMLPVRLH